MRLARFIVDHMERILQEWEDFARTLAGGGGMSVASLRDHAEAMLRFIAADLETVQSNGEQFAKSVGRGPELPEGESSAAHTHGHVRAVEHFTLGELVSEYRALRGSVTHMWLATGPDPRAAVDQLVRFNEAVDQILAESVVRYSRKLDADASLLVATIGHDLRSPVNAIAMAGQLLARSPTLGQGERATVARINGASHRIAGMLAELHEFTQATFGAAGGFRLASADVAALCRGAAGEVEMAHPGRRIVVEATGATTADVDEGRFAQMVANLLGNAIQHGDATSPVVLRVQGSDGELSVAVHNGGPPIEPSALDTIFEPMQRGRKPRVDEAGSLGLGLYIVRNIVRGHGGTIAVASDAAAGTTFTVRIPRVSPAQTTTAG